MPNESVRIVDVIAWYSENAPGSLEGLREPATAAERMPLPTEVAELYAVCDGEAFNSVGILPQYRLLPLADAIEFRDMMIGITTPPVFDDPPLYSGFTRSELEASGHDPYQNVYGRAEDGSFEVFSPVPPGLSPEEVLEWEERELQRAGQMLELLSGSAEEYRRSQEIDLELDDYRFTEDHLPIAQWDSWCIVVAISTGLVFTWDPVEGRGLSWPSLGALYSELLAALTGGPPFMWRIPTVVEGAVEWEFDESILESEQPMPSYDEPESDGAWDGDNVAVIEFFIDLTTFEGVADYLGGEDRKPSSIPFDALESADFTTPQRGRITILAFADSAQAHEFREYAARNALHIATLDDQFAIVVDTAEGAADLQSSVTFD